MFTRSQTGPGLAMVWGSPNHPEENDMLPTRFTDLVGCLAPVQQAGMGGVATTELAAAVARAGGLGMLSGVMVPPPALAAMLDAIPHDGDGAVGVNFLMPFIQGTEAVEVAAAGARVVELFYGGPDPALVDVVHRGGALAFWQVGSAHEARAAVDAGCDAVVVQGTEAGGHVRGGTRLFPLLAAALDLVDVPVIAAGGIATPRHVATALAAGASAVRVGTRFVATAESGAHPAYVDALLAADAGDTVLTEAFSVMWPNAPHRVLGSCIDAAAAHDGDLVGEVGLGDEAMSIPRFAIIPPSRETTGDIGAMALYAGESVGSVTSVVPAADVVRELVEGAEALLSTWNATST
ncbi:MAG: nitronate monooxygenase [Acidimicrobiia bacterium]|nr:nitronate monooxygenase [Acidimicrobiia bacterium]